jgi:hypothetical protein
MPRKLNKSRPTQFKVTISTQTKQVLEMLASRGVFGRTASEVAGRFLEQAIQQFTVMPKFQAKDDGTVEEVKA